MMAACLTALSSRGERPVVVAMIAMGVMQVPVHQEVDVVAVRYGFVPAALPVRMPGLAVGGLGMAVRMFCVGADHVLVHVAFMGMVKLTVVEVVDVVVVPHRGMAAARSVDVRVLTLVNCVSHTATIHAARTASKDPIRARHSHLRLPPGALDAPTVARL